MTMPRTGDRLLVMNCTDGWNNTFAMIGTRTEGGEGGNWMFAGPAWKGKVPKGVKLLRSQTAMVVVATRIRVKSRDDAVYVFLNTDAEGAKLDGRGKYLIRFEPGQLPPVRGFWSFTVYNKGFYLPANIAIDRHVLNNNSPLTFGKDGSVEFYLQPDSPGPDKESRSWIASGSSR